ncbi:hypothetical protein BH11PLA2_BH11PLA2_18350 [soil metagenome]
MKVYKGREAVAFLTGEIFGGESNVVCPNCRSDYTHVHHVGTLVGTDQYEAVAAYDGTNPTGATPSRRSAVEIVFSCENCPEFFALVIQQHKGNNLVEVQQNVGCRTE